MKRIAIVICTVGLVSTHLSAQRAAGRLGSGIGRPVSPTFGRTGFGSRFGAHRFQNFGGTFPWIYPAFYGDYGWPGDFAGDYQPQPTIFLVMPPPQAPPEPPPPPPPPPAPVIREYHWPTSPNPPESFSIVLNDGTTHYATMAWVQAGRIYFNAPEGGVRQLPLSAISREQTRAANARKNLNLPLP